MKTFLILIFAAIFVASANCALSIEQTSPADLAAHPGKCVSKVHGIMSFGEVNNHGPDCSRISCSGGVIETASCGVVVVKPPCKLAPPDLTKPYPECCPKPDEKTCTSFSGTL